MSSIQWSRSSLVALFAAVLALSSPRLAVAQNLGANVIVFDASMPIGQIQATVDAIHAQQVDDEMGSHRYALLFKPGVYGSASQPLQIKVGYYTEVAGLGPSPLDVTINGKIEVYNRCFAGGGSNCHALLNTWRNVSNLSIAVNGTGQDGCRASANFWAVAQGSLRRVIITGGTVSLMDYCTAGPQYATGGFIADSQLPSVINGSQQQGLFRNSSVGSWSNGVWNQVFAGVENAPSEAGFPAPPYTTLETTPISREKPYLFVDALGAYQVRVPAAQTDSRGVSWNGPAAGVTIPLSAFFIARPSDSVQTINSQLARGKHLLLTPGSYAISRGIDVKRANTVVLGLGYATLTAINGAIPVTIADAPGVILAGVLIDAGTVESPALLQIGKKHGKNGKPHNDATNPTTLSDVYFRVGGPHIGKTDVALDVNSDSVLLDHVWIWRADHGTEGLADDTARWNTNIGRNGAVITGDNVTATALIVDHFQEHNTVWHGDNGTTISYWSELAYDAPTQAAWTHDGVDGWAAYKVAEAVTTHTLYGSGVYVFNRNNPSIHTENGFEVPDAPGVQLHHVLTVNAGAGTIDHVVNGVGAPADTTRIGAPVYLVSYP